MVSALPRPLATSGTPRDRHRIVSHRPAERLSSHRQARPAPNFRCSCLGTLVPVSSCVTTSRTQRAQVAIAVQADLQATTSPNDMPSDLSYWLISVPLHDGDPSTVLADVRSATGGNVTCGGWEIPDLKVRKTCLYNMATMERIILTRYSSGTVVVQMFGRADIPGWNPVVADLAFGRSAQDRCHVHADRVQAARHAPFARQRRQGAPAAARARQRSSCRGVSHPRPEGIGFMALGQGTMGRGR